MVLKSILFAVLCGLTGLLFKQTKPEYSIFINIAMGVWLLSCSVEYMEQILQQFIRLGALFRGMEASVVILFKVVGMTYLCEFGAGICRDSGCATLGNQIEILGKLAIMLMGFPILLQVIERMQAFM